MMDAGSWIALVGLSITALFSTLGFAFSLTERLRRRHEKDANLDVHDARLEVRVQRLEDAARKAEELSLEFAALKAENKRDHEYVREALQDLRAGHKEDCAKLERLIEQLQAQIRNVALGRADTAQEIPLKAARG